MEPKASSAVLFEDERNAYNALTALEELDAQQRVRVQEAVVVCAARTACGRNPGKHDKAAVDAKLDQGKLNRGQEDPASGLGARRGDSVLGPAVGPLYPIWRVAPQHLHPS